MTDTGSIQREIRRRITNEKKMASQKCGDELQNLQGAEDSFAFLAFFSLFKRLQLTMECCLRTFAPKMFPRTDFF